MLKITLLKNLRQLFLFSLYLLLPGNSSLYSQEFTFGPKGGLNYSVDKKGAQIDGSAGSFNAEPQMGYQVGLFAQVKIGQMLLRPEVFYSHAEGEFPFPDQPSQYSIDKISIPLLLGFNFYRDFSVFGGPAYQLFIDTSLENTRDPVLNQQRNLAAQIGILYELGRFQVDLRYDFTFSGEENQRIEISGVMNNALFDDGRLNQFMLSLSFKLWDSTNPWMLRRKRSCYF